MSEVTWKVGTVRQDGKARMDGLPYDRAGMSPWVSSDVDTIFLSVGRTPFALASGGYYSPREDDE